MTQVQIAYSQPELKGPLGELSENLKCERVDARTLLVESSSSTTGVVRLEVDIQRFRFYERQAEQRDGYVSADARRHNWEEARKVWSELLHGHESGDVNMSSAPGLALPPTAVFGLSPAQGGILEGRSASDVRGLYWLTWAVVTVAAVTYPPLWPLSLIVVAANCWLPRRWISHVVWGLAGLTAAASTLWFERFGVLNSSGLLVVLVVPALWTVLSTKSLPGVILVGAVLGYASSKAGLWILVVAALLILVDGVLPARSRPLLSAPVVALTGGAALLCSAITSSLLLGQLGYALALTPRVSPWALIGVATALLVFCLQVPLGVTRGIGPALSLPVALGILSFTFGGSPKLFAIELAVPFALSAGALIVTRRAPVSATK